MYKKFLFFIPLLMLLPSVAFAASIASYTVPSGTDSDAIGYNGSQTYLAQPFTVSSSGAVSSVSVALTAFGTPADNLTLLLETDSSGHPSGTVLEFVTFTPVAGVNVVPFAGTTVLSTSTTYWLVFARTGANSTINYWQDLRSTVAIPYSPYVIGTSIPNWSNVTGYNLYFEVDSNSTPPAPAVGFDWSSIFGLAAATTTLATTTITTVSIVDIPTLDAFLGMVCFMCGMWLMLWLFKRRN